MARYQCRRCGASMDGLDHASRRVFCSRTCRGLAHRKARPEPSSPPPAGAAWLPLPCGRLALVDADMMASLAPYTWRSHPGRKHVSAPINGHTVMLHRFVMGDPDGLVDHRFGDWLDNRRSQLRVATSAENIHNARKMASRKGAPTTSRFRGVYYIKANRKWCAMVRSDGVNRYIGSFLVEEDAARAYDRRVRELHGEFACVNFPRDGERSAI